ncbi:MAG: 4'-phosphopantetheinyl transferase superfamily protein [Phaeodactylibacter sp.]|uniref:4'-phosphopantetheinyl transferase family protein n=1 Tax=Phaeodactylibacter sp. TaxID=1940289 RepID=UPI0032EC5795
MPSDNHADLPLLTLHCIQALEKGVVVTIAGKAAPEAWYNTLLKRLNTAEKAQLSRFRNNAQHGVYLSAHAVLNTLLGACTGENPAELQFSFGTQRKPYLVPTEVGLYFNLSHSGDYFLIGLLKNREIGVDVEVHRAGIPTVVLAQRFFHPQEQELLGNESTFFDTWTRKEAFLKALGTGLNYPITSFDATKDRILTDKGFVALKSLPYFEGASAAIAIAQEIPPLQAYQLWAPAEWELFLEKG